MFENSWKHMWHYHSIMGPIQNMEAMFQTWKSTILRKDLHTGPIGSFPYECNQKNSAFDDSLINVVASKLNCISMQLCSFLHIVLFLVKSSFPFSCCVFLSQVFSPRIICASPFNRHYFHATNLKIYLNENRMFKIDYENISKLFSIFIKYSFNILLFHNINLKKSL